MHFQRTQEIAWKCSLKLNFELQNAYIDNGKELKK